jgi:DNA-binding beta-propeller fold protein YncE
LSPKTLASVSTGAAPLGLAATPDGKSLYVVNSSPTVNLPTISTISQYNIDPTTGAPSTKTTASVDAAVGAGSIAVTRDGTSAYVPADSTILQYNIDPTSGALSPKNPASVGAPFGPVSIALR